MEDQRPHKKLELWKQAMRLVVAVYERTRDLPREEEFGLKSQMRRASVSIPSNIAEGLARTSHKEKVRFLDISHGSLSELDAQVEIAGLLGYFSDKQVRELQDSLNFVGRLLGGLMRSIRRK